MKAEIAISPKKVFQALTLVVLCLVLASLAVQFSRYVLGHGRLFGLVALFDIDSEHNIPTWYSSAALLFCSILLGTIGFAQKTATNRYARHWKALSLIFLYISLDEAASIHELSIVPLRAALNASGLFYFTWVILGIAFVLIVLLAYLRFLVALPVKTRRLFLLAGSIYIGGAIGMELIGGFYSELYGEQNLIYVFIVTVEESLEMMGIVFFIYALLSYMRSHGMRYLVIRIGDEHPQELLHPHSQELQKNSAFEVYKKG